MVDRRSLMTGALALGAALPAAAIARDTAFSKPEPLPDPALYPREREEYWSRLRGQFLIPADTVFMNPGTVGSSPRPVIDAVMAGFAQTERMDMPQSDEYPLWGYKRSWDEFRRPLANFLGCGVSQLALLRNTTEGNNYVAAGLKLRRGDEVILSNEEHRSLEQPWLLRAKRDGIAVKRFVLPRPAKSAAEILNRIEAQITPRTRMIFVSHVTSPTGLVLPVREIAALARARGILCAVDGAQSPGMMPLDVEAIGCDIYTGSLHKWLHAPKGTGFLYIKDEVLDRIWVTVTTGGWDEPELGAERFMRVGTSSLPLLWGMLAAIDFANAIGMEHIERRQRALARYAHDQMVARGAKSWMSDDPALRCAIATVNVPRISRMELQDWLWAQHRIRIRGGEPSRLRLCTPYFLLRSDVDRFLRAYDEFAAMKASRT